jgi:hypothetical protein
MKKIILVFLTTAFVFTLGSCEAPKDKKHHKEMKKEKHEKRW